MESSPETFEVSLENFSGPFDVLLDLIQARRLELTEVSLSAVTSEFINYVKHLDASVSADRASSFLSVASVLVQAKSVALLPDADTPRDDDSLEALEQRDLLFAHLLQYRAFKQAGESFATSIVAADRAHVHPVQLSESVKSALTSVEVPVNLEQFAQIAAQALRNAPLQHVTLAQLHTPLADVRHETRRVTARLKSVASLTFSELIDDAEDMSVVVARFLSLLLLYRQGAIQMRQSEPNATLEIRWGGENGPRRNSHSDSQRIDQVSERGEA